MHKREWITLKRHDEVYNAFYDGKHEYFVASIHYWPSTGVYKVFSANYGKWGLLGEFLTLVEAKDFVEANF